MRTCEIFSPKFLCAIFVNFHLICIQYLAVINQHGTTSYIRSIRIPHINYILLGMFCCLAFLQNSVFVEWNAIANSALAAFHPEWTAATLAWQINLATITSPFIQWPVWFAIQKYGKY